MWLSCCIRQWEQSRTLTKRKDINMDPSTSMYVAQGIHGIAYGMVLFLVASGLTIIFGMMGILNMAHAAIFMLSGYFCYQVIAMTGSFWAGLVLAPIGTGIFGIVLERVFIRSIRASGHLGQLIMTLGLSLVILGLVKIFWGTES